MCPATLAIIAVGASAGSSILGGLSSAGQANYQAQVARNNAVLAREKAGYTAGATATETEVAGLKARAQQGEVRAGLAANNLEVNTGSPAGVQTGQRILGGFEQATAANRGAQQVYGYETTAASEEAQAKLYQSEVAPDILGGVLGAAGKVAGAGADLPSLTSGPSTLPSDYGWMSFENMPGLDEEFGKAVTPSSQIGTPYPF